MGAPLKAVAVIFVAVILIAGGLWVYSAVPQPPERQAATMKIDFTAIDSLAGGADAATSAVGIYRQVGSDFVSQEAVTIAAASTASALTYTSGEVLWLKMYDASDTSICTQYVKFIVPLADPSEIYGQAFQVRLNYVDKGDTTKDILIKCHNNTGLTASTLYDLTNSGWDSSYAEIDIEIRALDDDTGYVNTFNFLNNYDNNHYVVISAAGTGWDSVNLLTNGWSTFDKASTRYFVKQLSDTDITRDKLGVGTYNPDGTWGQGLSFDLTGFASGDNVTLTYEYRWYSSESHFQDFSAWGVNTAATTEYIYIQY